MGRNPLGWTMVAWHSPEHMGEIEDYATEREARAAARLCSELYGTGAQVYPYYEEEED